MNANDTSRSAVEAEIDAIEARAKETAASLFEIARDMGNGDYQKVLDIVNQCHRDAPKGSDAEFEYSLQAVELMKLIRKEQDR
jgi:hypothetical protein